MPPRSEDEARRFLEAVFVDKPQSLYALIWSLPSKRSEWFQDLAAAARHGAREERANVYMGVGLSEHDYGPNARCKADAIAGIGGLWADIDIAGDTHKKPNLPRSQEDALALVRELPTQPSAVIHSGGGLQVWWLFNELWVFESGSEREHAAQLSRRFHETLRNHAHRRGTDIDATSDLSRVMRLPGTQNQKVAATPRPVTILELDETRRYDPSDFEDFLSPDPGAKTSGSVVRELSETTAQRLKLSAAANPPFDKFHALYENDDVARRTWNEKRTDLKDASASAYDLAMANICVIANWSDQEIANTLIAMRRKHGKDLKLRHGYYGLTIAKARAGAVEEEQVEEAYESVEQTLRGEPAELEPLEALNRILGTEISGIRKLKMHPVQYFMRLKDGRIGYFRSSDIQRFTNFELKYFEVGDKWPRVKKAKKWAELRDLIANHISQVGQQDDLGPEALEAGPVIEWLDEYLSWRRPKTGLDRKVIMRDEPWVDDDGNVYVRLHKFREYIDRYMGTKLEGRQLPKHLKAAGFDRCIRKVGQITRSYWYLPVNLALKAGIKNYATQDKG